jgi:phage shock protein C
MSFEEATMLCNECKVRVNQGAAFCSGCGKPMAFEAGYGPFWGRQGSLMRPRVGRKIAGVCAGFALQYGFDVTLLRILLVLVVVMGAGTPLIAYIAAWVLMPEAPFVVPAQPMPQDMPGAAVS